MREIRTSGSEGGGTGYSTGPPYPYQGRNVLTGFCCSPSSPGEGDGVVGRRGPG